MKQVNSADGFRVDDDGNDDDDGFDLDVSFAVSSSLSAISVRLADSRIALRAATTSWCGLLRLLISIHVFAHPPPRIIPRFPKLCSYRDVCLGWASFDQRGTMFEYV